MVEVNLIRWRSIQRHQAFSKLVLDICVATSLAVFIVWQLHLWAQADVFRQSNHLRQKELALKKLTATPIIKTISAAEISQYQQQYFKINNLIDSHKQTHQLFKRLDALIPNQIRLTQVQLKKEQLLLKGISYSNPALTQFLAQLSQLPAFQNPQLSFSLKNKNESVRTEFSKEQNRRKYFELHVTFVSDVKA